jgi:hypothetical protein
MFHSLDLVLHICNLQYLQGKVYMYWFFSSKELAEFKNPENWSGWFGTVLFLVRFQALQAISQ